MAARKGGFYFDNMRAATPAKSFEKWSDRDVMIFRNEFDAWYLREFRAEVIDFKRTGQEAGADFLVVDSLGNRTEFQHVLGGDQSDQLIEIKFEEVQVFIVDLAKSLDCGLSVGLKRIPRDTIQRRELAQEIHRCISGESVNFEESKWLRRLEILEQHGVGLSGPTTSFGSELRQFAYAVELKKEKARNRHLIVTVLGPTATLGIDELSEVARQYNYKSVALHKRIWNKILTIVPPDLGVHED